jgi:hypothetical protein
MLLTPAVVPRLLRQVPELLATSMARLQALDPDLVRGELDRAGEVPVTVPALLAALARFAAESGRTDLAELTAHQAVACLRALVEVAGWDHQGVAAAHVGHPWLVSGPAFARRLAALTRTPVRAR